MGHSWQVVPFLSLNFPLPQGWHSVAAFVLDVPAVQFSHNSLAVGLLPFVPALHAINPDGAVVSILDPGGTMTEEDPPIVTIDPALTLLQSDCSGSGCKYPLGHLLHSTLPFLLENLPGEQGKQLAAPSPLMYWPILQSKQVSLPGASW